jgi:peptidoglycan-N-acetylglucosamine deacetylase
LTFDDGPGQATRDVLSLLAVHDARATFFMDGSQVEEHPDLAREVKAAGHEIGSHAMNHGNHDASLPEEAVADMVRGAEAIATALDVEPRLYRAPYGYFVPATVAEADRRGWTCVAWSAEGRDWEETETAESVADRIRPGLVPGAIVLLHDSRRGKPMDTDRLLGATGLILKELERRGLHARTVSDILS